MSKNKLIKNSIVLNSLIFLTEKLNIGLLHPNDEEKIIDLFLRLHFLGKLKDENSENIYLWAINNNWSDNSAQKLKDIFKGVNDGNIKISKKHWDDNILNILEKKQ